MRRTNEEFKKELFNRSEKYKIEQKKKHKKAVLVMFPIVCVCLISSSAIMNITKDNGVYQNSIDSVFDKTDKSNKVEFSDSVTAQNNSSSLLDLIHSQGGSQTLNNSCSFDNSKDVVQIHNSSLDNTKNSISIEPKETKNINETKDTKETKSDSKKESQNKNTSNLNTENKNTTNQINSTVKVNGTSNSDNFNNSTKFTEPSKVIQYSTQHKVLHSGIFITNSPSLPIFNTGNNDDKFESAELRRLMKNDNNQVVQKGQSVFINNDELYNYVKGIDISKSQVVSDFSKEVYSDSFEIVFYYEDNICDMYTYYNGNILVYAGKGYVIDKETTSKLIDMVNKLLK